MFYSASTNGFYAKEIHGDAIPIDAVEVTDNAYQLLFVAQSEGKRIVAGGDGHPIASENLNSELQPWLDHQTKAQEAINKSDRTIIRCYERGVEVPSTWVSYRNALREIIRTKNGDPTAALPAEPTYPSGT